MDKKIKILYESSILNNFDSNSGGRTGIYWTAFNLLKHLAKRPDVELYLYSNDYEKTKKFIKHVSPDIQKLSLYYDDVKSMDVVFSPCLKIHDKIRNTRINCFTLLHDCIPLIFPLYFDKNGTSWFMQMFNAINEKDYYFSNSEYTKSDFLKFSTKIDKLKITTIPLSTNQPYQPNKNEEKLKEVKEKYNIPHNKKYLFSLCSLEPRKNLIRSVKTFIEFINKNKIDDLVFVLGGSAWSGFISKFEKEVPDYQKYQDKIIKAGYVDDADMETLYSNAEWFVYTSQYEGFGMPPLEAMKCGCPVITSNNSSLPEVVGDAGIMIDWDSDEQHIQSYEKYYFDKEFKNTMTQKGKERSLLFSWEKAAEIMVNQFKSCPQNQKRLSLILKDELFNPNRCKISIKLFKAIPFLKIQKKPNQMKVFLFNVLPILKFKQGNRFKTWRLLGLPVFKIKSVKKGRAQKYYILGLEMLKISKKTL